MLLDEWSITGCYRLFKVVAMSTGVGLVVTGGVELDPTPLHPGSADACRFAASAWATSTRRTYRTQWRAFVEWCDSRHVTPLPAEPVVVADYIAKRATEGSKVATIAVALAAITEAHRVAGFDSPRGSATV